MNTRIRTSVVCINNGHILTHKAVDPSSGLHYHFLPGGKKEDHETLLQCGERETLEETGYRVTVDPLSELLTEYCFTWHSQEVFCKTYLFKASLTQLGEAPLPTNDSSYNKGAHWLPLESIEETFSYSNTLLKGIRALLAGN
ncbi:MAG: NUDIX hydrolase [Bdellovibrionaceae bacterium]|jgi:8-oxo-dGTP pyrophosphatase MutT (NUDIX family)|nr:NUDIX hydrolase [Pseudobdellovibrionaceae bacterium]